MNRAMIDDAILADYASGALPPGMSLLVAAHLTFSPDARSRAAGFEAIGGALLDAPALAGLSAPSLDAVLARLDTPAPLPRAVRAPAAPSVMPRCLTDALGVSEHDAPWKFRLPGLAEAMIDGFDGEEVSFLRARPGAPIFAHTHEGVEATLVLCGALEDRGQVFRRGDVAMATEADDHRPRILDEGLCICFVVATGKMRFTGPFSRALNYLAD
ncbi:MAG: putative transcriptional regulator [Paracoccaceae bacterium]|jgi:putative transcriptional regulator